MNSDSIYNKETIEYIQDHFLNKNKKSFGKYQNFVFLCGKTFDKNNYYSTNRGITESYIKKKDGQYTKIVLSENLYKSYSKNIDVLSFERLLLKLSNFLILFVESPGTFCELGAFSVYSENYNDLIVLIDKSHEKDESFINQGPIEILKKNKAKIIYADLEDGGLLSSREFVEQLNQICNSSIKGEYKQINKDNNVNFNSFLFEILEIIYLFQPITKAECINLYKRIKNIKGFTILDDVSVRSVFDLLINSNMVIKNKDLFFTNEIIPEKLMFEYSAKGYNKLRSKIICRKYKSGKQLCKKA